MIIAEAATAETPTAGLLAVTAKDGDCCTAFHIYIYIYITYIYIYTHMYVYIYRERERYS